MMRELSVHPTRIPGLLVVDLPVQEDGRGWFKENWQRAKMTGLGLPDFGPVQNNVSFNAAIGATRGLHAEPWDKFVSLAYGRIFGVWVDLRAGETFGQNVTLTLGPDRAVFVPKGVANGFQALEPQTVYTYLVNDHWSPQARNRYTYLNLADPQLAIQWPIPLAEAGISAADAQHPALSEIDPVPSGVTAVIGANGQLGRALVERMPHALALSRPEFDLLEPSTFQTVDWNHVDLIINAAAYTAVDLAESQAGRRDCWAVNVTGLGNLVETARRHRIPMVHVSSDYVFDGNGELHREDEPLSPLGVYGQTKAAGEALVSTLDRHWIVRTSWMVGEGPNFVRTMMSLASRGTNPEVVGDQFGRLTFAGDLAAGIEHLVRVGAPSGIYHVTNDGPVVTWASIAKRIFQIMGRSPADVTEVTTDQYAAGSDVSAPRPRHSALDLSRVQEFGFAPAQMDQRLEEYVRNG